MVNIKKDSASVKKRELLERLGVSEDALNDMSSNDLVELLISKLGVPATAGDVVEIKKEIEGLKDFKTSIDELNESRKNQYEQKKNQLKKAEEDREKSSKALSEQVKSSKELVKKATELSAKIETVEVDKQSVVKALNASTAELSNVAEERDTLKNLVEQSASREAQYLEFLSAQSAQIESQNALIESQSKREQILSSEVNQLASAVQSFPQLVSVMMDQTRQEMLDSVQSYLGSKLASLNTNLQALGGHFESMAIATENGVADIKHALETAEGMTEENKEVLLESKQALEGLQTLAREFENSSTASAERVEKSTREGLAEAKRMDTKLSSLQRKLTDEGIEFLTGIANNMQNEVLKDTGEIKANVKTAVNQGFHDMEKTSKEKMDTFLEEIKSRLVDSSEIMMGSEADEENPLVKLTNEMEKVASAIEKNSVATADSEAQKAQLDELSKTVGALQQSVDFFAKAMAQFAPDNTKGEIE